jgi:hypothetical protein
MADNNPYLVVGSPNYAAPMIDFSALNPNAPNKQNNQNNPQGQNQGQQPGQKPKSPFQNFANSLQSFLQPAAPGAGAGPAAMGPQAYGGPLQLTPGSVDGANAMLSGIY